jgi:peptidoglycan/LPS O-acetylase OafA/YrhL
LCILLFVSSGIAEHVKIINRIGNSFLAVLLSRLSFSLFMTHVIFVNLLHCQIQHPWKLIIFESFKDGIVVLILSVPTSYLMLVMVEYPFDRITKILLDERALDLKNETKVATSDVNENFKTK